MFIHTEEYPLTSYQKDIWIEQILYPDKPFYNIGGYTEIIGEINLRIFQETIDYLMKENDALRTIFFEKSGQPYQRFLTQIEYAVSVYDFSNEENPSEYSINWMANEMLMPYNIYNNILFTSCLIKAGENLYYIFCKAHHLITDGYGFSLIGKRVREIYTALLSERQDFVKNTYSYIDFILEDYNYRNAEDRIFWREKLKGLPEPLIPRKIIVNKDDSSLITSSRESIVVEQHLYNRIIEFCKVNKCSAFHFFLGILAVYFGRVCSKNELVIGVPILNRRNSKFKSTIGLFVNIIPLTISIHSGQNFTNLMQKIRENLKECYRHQKLSLGEILNELGGNTEDKKSVFDIILSYEKHSHDSIFCGHPAHSEALTHWNEKNALSVFIREFDSEDDVKIDFDYQLGVFDNIFSMKNIVRHFNNLINEVLMNGTKDVTGLDYLSQEEKAEILYRFNDTKADYHKDKTIHEAFEEQVERTPDNIAVVFRGNQLTYRELNNKANSLARVLIEKGVKPDAIVGIMAERSLEMIIGIYAILKAGGAYLPIDPGFPNDRINYIISDSGAGIILMQEKFKAKTDLAVTILNIEDENLYHRDISNPGHTSTSGNLAYVIYTSGSTGNPKGVMIEHYSVINRLNWMQKMYPIGPGDVILQKTTCTFDVSVWELFWWGHFGARVCMLIPGGEKDPGEIADAIEKYSVTTVHFVPSMLKIFLEYLEHFKEFERVSGLRQVYASGEALTLSQIEKFNKYINKNYGAKLHNLYGPTEATVDVSYFDCSSNKKLERIPIGKPIDNIQLYIVDAYNNLLPVGVPGELCIAGDGLARGYLNRPELTKEKFVPNPFIPGERMYRTGDLARWLPDGNIEYLGRMDHQVKIRGFRIELGEIETQLLKHRQIREAVVIPKDDSDGGKYLCAYYVSDSELSLEELRGHLSGELPDYMVPPYFIHLDDIPLSHNGKIDRKALPEPDGNISTGIPYIAPTNGIEEELVTIWQEVLEVERVGINDNFFELGGHSLKATLLVSKIHKEFNVEMPLREIFNLPTVKGLAAYIKSTDESIYSSIIPAGEKEYYPVSAAQKRLYILNQFERAGKSYNMPCTILMEGKLDTNRFEDAFRALIRRHETLRTSFEMSDGEPVQKVHREAEFKVDYFESGEDNAGRIVNEFIRPFDLNKAPLLRVGFIKIGNDRHLLMFDMHHLISDGTSVNILVREFSQLYEGQEPAGLKIQYKDFSQWQNELLRTGGIKKQEEYWLHKFEDEVPVLNMPTDYQRPPVQSFEGDRIAFEVDEEISQKVNSLAKKTGTTLYMVLLAAYNALLYRYTGQEDIVVGSPVAGRPHADLQDIIGMFVNTLAMRNYPSGEKTFNEFLAEVRESCIKAYGNQDYQFEELVDKLNIKRDMSRNPLFDTMFVLQNTNSRDIQVNGLKIITQTVENRTSKFDITLNAWEQNGKIAFEVEYCTKLFGKETIERFSKHFTNILSNITADLNTRLSELNIITDEEREKILYTFNNTKEDYPKDKTIHEIFEEQVEKTPDNIAVVFEKSKLTYRELNDKSNSLAWVLREKGVQPDTIVGIIAERSIEMIIGITGILKAGGAYLPIDPRYPQERINFMLKDSGTGILLTCDYLIGKTDFAGYIVNLSDSNLYAGNTLNPDKTGTPKHLAYVMYTSGSTGKPKGVMVEHRSVVRLVKNTNYIDFEENDSILQTGALAFDATTFEFWGALLNGLKLYIADENIILDPINLSAAIKKYDISTMWLTSPLFNQFSTQKPEIFNGLKKLLVGGDKLSPAHINAVRNVCPGLIITNGYGPTENTTFSVCFKINKTYEQNIPIGIPVNNSTAYILDKYDNLQPMGVSGELCVGGDGLARGYINRQELTAEKFVTNPFMPGERMYRTGDMARWLPDGNIEFLGRMDNQVKIRGFRIEPGEIEAQLLGNPSIKEAVVLENKDENGDGSLCAYVVAQAGCHMEDIKEGLRKSLPDYMIPSHFIEIEQIPLTSNGKINKKMLPKPSDSVNTGVEYIAPKTDYEKVIADIWREVLNREQIGITDNFFDIGGNSLSIIRLSSLINQKLKGKFAGEISTTTLFQYPTISSLMNYLNNGQEDPEELNINKNDRLINKDVAVIGLSGRFPGAASVNEFWENIKNGIESITHFTDDELREEGIEEDLLKNPHYIKAKGIIGEPEYFDAAFFDYSPGDAKLLDPQIRIFHECVWEALESAGYDPYSYGGLIGLFAGASNNTVWQTLVSDYTNQSNTSYLFSNYQLADKDFLTTRISYKLNLRGPSMIVQTACSTSLVAVNVAYQKLLEGECDIALAGGVSVTFPHKNGYLFQEGMIMSSDGHCRSFDAEASGTVSGEGAGVVVLKRLEDAVKDGDHIWAVIKGSRINNDGAGKVGYTAPSVEGQARVIREACHFAEVSTETIGYVEAHGTATALGDPIEIEALKKAFNTTKRNYCAIGSVKTNCGHLDTAAGVTGLIKTVLSLYNKQIPPSLHYKSPNPKIDFKNSPFYVNESLRDWERKEYPLRAGVSSFGIGGTNAHVILEESPVTESTQESGRWYMLPLSAKTPGVLDKLSGKFAEYMQRNQDINLSDLSYTMQVGRAQLKYRRVVVFQDLQDAVNQLNKNHTAEIAKQDNGKVVFMFSGQGYQYVNMLREFYESEQAFREEMDNCFCILEPMLTFNIKDILFPEDSSDNMEVTDTLVAQPLNFIIQYSLARTLIKWGIKPEALIGHSLGEYVAACLAEVLTLEDALDLIVLRGRLMQQLPKGGMLGVVISETELKPLLIEEVSLAAVNSSSICVVSGSQESIDLLEEKLNKMGYECMKVPASHAFHSNAMSAMLPLFKDKLERIELKKPDIPYISNVTGTWITAQDATNPEYWAEHTTGTVRFADGIGELFRKNFTVFIEIGAGRTLNTSVKLHEDCTPDILVVNLIRHSKEERGGQSQRLNISALFKSLPEEASDMSFILTQLGRLWCAGIKIDWKQFYKNGKRRRIPLPTYPFQRQRYWIDKEHRGYLKTLDFRYTDNYKRREVGEWFFIPIWRRGNLSYGSKDFKTFKNILVFIDQTDFGNNLAGSLESAGKQLTFVKSGASFCQDRDIESGYFINPDISDDYKNLFRELYKSQNIPDTILYLWTLTEDNLHESDWDKVNTAVDMGFYGLIYIAQAIGELNIPDQISINVVTNSMHMVSGEENINPEKAVIAGPIRTIPKEYTNIKCTGIDIVVPQEDKAKEQQLINCLLAEMAATDNEPLVAYRGNYRWRQSFDEIQLNECKGVPWRLRENGVYVITGGLGGIGLAISEYLAGAVRARLVLIGRTEIPPRENWDDYINSTEKDSKLAYKIMKIKELEELGTEVLPINADVSDNYRMSKAMSVIHERFGEVNGVIHSAGLPDGGLIQLRNRETTDSIMSSKIQGTLEINKFIEHNKLDFMIYCSSLSSIIAPFGQIGYCSANNFQDAFSQHQCNKGHTYTASINWDTWKQTGMAVNLACAHSSDNLENGMLISEGIEVFKRILNSNLPNHLLAQVLISPYPLEAYLKRIWDMEHEQFKIKSEESNNPEESLNLQDITSQSDIESKLTDILKEILGYPDIGRDDNFFDLGAYSLHLIQLRQRLKAVLNVDISIVSLYANTTISSLSRYLFKRDEAQYSITDEESSDFVSKRRNKKNILLQREKRNEIHGRD
ncbi:hybrid non-ribosomal peptide synthetase/type I polyketide synthase [Ruminiclostridium papyrosolvens]|uniref:Phenolphthiocerol/phthiocerol polyketide synthase subunit E n=1 Tax=Ruminiclostridium papyrosolvens C7 TaxID=1330534 RepID=U4R156_9FIRM|nr:hybrid non-ribosomal peptide synthetase/type I polyketide synthase [Ruminiclostridium papyrosolvens]EPR11938.1 thioester reductase [Ruminiclostridium papyrosolvens C7]